MAATDAKVADIDFINQLSTEIDDEKTKRKIKHKTSVDDWIPINAAFRRGDVQYIKGLIMNYEIAINDDRDPAYKASLLHKAAIYGTYEIVQVLLSYGANIYAEDKIGQTPFDCARRFGNFHVLELLLFHEMGASSGLEVKNVLNDMQRQDALTTFMLNTSKPDTLNDIVDTIIIAMKKRAPFSDDILIIAWQYTLRKAQDSIFFNPLQSDLFLSIMDAFESILTNIKDKLGWSWVRNYLMKSTLWFRKHPDYDETAEDAKKDSDDADDGQENEFDVKGVLFEEILVRVQREGKRQIELRLKNDLLAIKAKHNEDWNNMMRYNTRKVDSNSLSKYTVARARQDVIPKGLVPEYSDKSFFTFDCAVSFNPRLHYDISLYLNELVMRANIIDQVFQKDVELLVNKITNDLKLQDVLYKRGPVKAMERSKAKVEGEYFREDFPTAACLMDINRCTIMFVDVNSLMQFLYEFDKMIEGGTTSLKGIIRCKNGWNMISDQLDNLQYTDIKFNVIIEAFGKSIVGEIQFLLEIMSNFKLVAHALYGIERQQEFVSNLKQLKPTIMDHEKQLFTLANHGDSKGLCLFMVNNMITPKQIMTYLDKGGNNILFSICKRNKIRAFLMLRKMSSPAEFKTYVTLFGEGSWNCIGWSLLSKSIDILEILVKDYPDLVFNYKHPKNQRTSMIMACENNNHVLLRWIIDKCDVRENKKRYYDRMHQTQGWNWTPLMICCRWQNFECLKVLLSSIDDVQEIYKYYCQEGKGGTTAFIACCSSGNANILAYLLNTLKEKKIENYIEKLYKLVYLDQIDHTKTDGGAIKKAGQIRLDEFHFDGENAFMYAVKKGHLECVQLIINELKGESEKLNEMVTHKSKTGHTAVQLAEENKLKEYQQVIKLLNSQSSKK
eukprot:115382_1